MLTVAINKPSPNLVAWNHHFIMLMDCMSGIQIEHIEMTGFCPTVPGASAGRTQKLRVTGGWSHLGMSYSWQLRLAVCWDFSWSWSDGLTPIHSLLMWFLLLGFFKFCVKAPKSKVLVHEIFMMQHWKSHDITSPYFFVLVVTEVCPGTMGRDTDTTLDEKSVNFAT